MSKPVVYTPELAKREMEKSEQFRQEIQTAMSTEMFPISGGPKIPWVMIAPHERQALLNHQQSLERLAQRGGLSCCEAVAVLSDRAWTRMEQSEAREQLIALVNKDQSAKVASLERRNAELTARVAELEKELSARQDDLNMQFGMLQQARQTADSFREQLAEARKDRQRLDWLIKEAFVASAGRDGICLVIPPNIKSTEARATIDDAMLPSPKETL